MSKIQILPENLANQIAAGEVIERPASVVKELVENAIDAGGGQVEVQVAGNGTRFIRVIDDGEGMDQDDILLCLERHATSKLSTADQLSAIQTLGFRGEAIPSIVSVSRMTIVSRMASSPLGAQVEIRFGQVRKVHEMGCAKGTAIEVRDLFGNVPARKKFLKTARTELGHIEEVVTNAALAHPHIGFRYVVDGRAILSFPGGVHSPEARVRQVLSWKNDSHLIYVTHESEQEGRIYSVHGYILPPEVSQPGTAKLRVFVNSRTVRDRVVSHAVAEGMHAFLMKGKRPAGVLFLEVPPEDVDVNVHPTKQEIRFQKSTLLHDLVVHAVHQGMEKYQDDIKYTVFGKSEKREQAVKSIRDVAQPPQAVMEIESNEHPSFAVQEQKPLFEHKTLSKTQSFPDKSQQASAEEKCQEKDETPKYTGVQEEYKEAGSARTLRYIGQLHNSYLLCASDSGLVVIDQHAAHERLLFETLKKQYASGRIVGQSLLFPEIIECTPEQQEILKNYQQEIDNLGIDISEFGGNSYAIKAVPAILSHVGPLEIIQGIFDRYLASDLKAKGSTTGIDDVLSLMACKAAVKANHELLPVEGRELLKKMEEADVFSHCPHGRPVIVQFTKAEIEKWFYR